MTHTQHSHHPQTLLTDQMEIMADTKEDGSAMPLAHYSVGEGSHITLRIHVSLVLGAWPLACVAARVRAGSCTWLPCAATTPGSACERPAASPHPPPQHTVALTHQLAPVHHHSPPPPPAGPWRPRVHPHGRRGARVRGVQPGARAQQQPHAQPQDALDAGADRGADRGRGEVRAQRVAHDRHGERAAGALGGGGSADACGARASRWRCSNDCRTLSLANLPAPHIHQQTPPPHPHPHPGHTLPVAPTWRRTLA
jgi:hypothetical protein